MSKQERKIVKVDEDKLKRMIAGEEEDIQGEMPVTEQTGEPPAERHRDKGGAPVRKKKAKADYADTYLRLNKPIGKRPITIQLSADNYERIENLLILSPGVSIAMFINNILDSHFEEYAGDIEEVIADRIKKLTNKQ